MGAAEMAETHVSWVVLLGDRAYELLKPVNLGFLDHRARANPERACRRETESTGASPRTSTWASLDVLERGRGARATT